MKAGDILKIQLGLKASTDSEQIEDRLRYKPDVFEFYTSENDFNVSDMILNGSKARAYKRS